MVYSQKCIDQNTNNATTRHNSCLILISYTGFQRNLKDHTAVLATEQRSKVDGTQSEEEPRKLTIVCHG